VEFDFTPLETTQQFSVCCDLEEFCADARNIEQLVLYWVSRTRSLVLSLSDSASPKQLGVSFFENGQIVGYACTTLRQLQTQYGCIPKLKETVYSYCDCDDYSADVDWFEKRNNRLNLAHFSEDNTLIAPPSALVELVLSYSLSSAGFAKIRECVDEDNEPNFLLAELVFLGINHERGWEEPVLFNKNQLRRYCDILKLCPSSPYFC
jgi:hypothetical protein